MNQDMERIPFCPKNVRQIGEVEGSNRIYIEDYVVTFLNQVSRKNELGSRAVLLLGDRYRAGDLNYYFVYGAIMGTRKRLEEGSFLFDADEREELLRTKEAEFPSYSILGWALVESQFNTISDDTVWKDMGQAFSSENKLFIRINTEDKNQSMFLRRQNICQIISGYQVFYDTNENMQNYLVGWHEQKQDPPTEKVRDLAMKQFRSNSSDKKEIISQRKTITFFYIASSVLMIILCVTGISMLNNYQKLKKVETAMNHLLDSMEEQKMMQAMSMQERENMDTLLQAVEQEQIAENEAQEEQPLIETPETGMTQPPAAADPQAAVTPLQEVSIQQQETEQTVVPEQAVVPEQPEHQTYMVKKGDTLSTISMQIYGTSRKVGEICALNNIQDPNNIMQEQKILLP